MPRSTNSKQLRKSGNLSFVSCLHFLGRVPLKPLAIAWTNTDSRGNSRRLQANIACPHETYRNTLELYKPLIPPHGRAWQSLAKPGRIAKTNLGLSSCLRSQGQIPLCNVFAPRSFQGPLSHFLLRIGPASISVRE